MNHRACLSRGVEEGGGGPRWGGGRMTEAGVRAGLVM